MQIFTKTAVAAIVVGVLGLSAHLMTAQKTTSLKAPSDVPASIVAPADLDLVLIANASGSQVYTCQAGPDGKLGWSLKGPDAELRDQSDKVIGKHFAGPSWKLHDGSEVTGKAIGHVDSPDPGSIAWLLVNVVTHAGTGRLANVTTIQRLYTHGGKPPADGCDESHKNVETKSAYTADYYFYAPKS